MTYVIVGLVVFQAYPLSLCEPLGEGARFLAKYPTGVFGHFVSGGSTPIKRTRSLVLSRRVSPSTTRLTYSMFGDVMPGSDGLRNATSAKKATLNSGNFQE